MAAIRSLRCLATTALSFVPPQSTTDLMVARFACARVPRSVPPRHANDGQPPARQPLCWDSRPLTPAPDNVGRCRGISEFEVSFCSSSLSLLENITNHESGLSGRHWQFVSTGLYRRGRASASACLSGNRPSVERRLNSSGRYGPSSKESPARICSFHAGSALQPAAATGERFFGGRPCR